MTLFTMALLPWPALPQASSESPCGRSGAARIAARRVRKLAAPSDSGVARALAADRGISLASDRGYATAAVTERLLVRRAPWHRRPLRGSHRSASKRRRIDAAAPGAARPVERCPGPDVHRARPRVPSLLDAGRRADAASLRARAGSGHRATAAPAREHAGRRARRAVPNVEEMLERTAATIPPALFFDAGAAQRFLDDQPALHAVFDNALFLVGEDGRIVAESPAMAGGDGRRRPHEPRPGTV